MTLGQPASDRSHALLVRNRRRRRLGLIDHLRQGFATLTDPSESSPHRVLAIRGRVYTQQDALRRRLDVHHCLVSLDC